MCGTDLHAAHGRLPVPTLPVIMGHEGAGIVESWEKGDRIPRATACCSSRARPAAPVRPATPDISGSARRPDLRHGARRDLRREDHGSGLVRAAASRRDLVRARGDPRGRGGDGLPRRRDPRGDHGWRADRRDRLRRCRPITPSCSPGCSVRRPIVACRCQRGALRRAQEAGADVTVRRERGERAQGHPPGRGWRRARAGDRVRRQEGLGRAPRWPRWREADA